MPPYVFTRLIYRCVNRIIAGRIPELTMSRKLTVLTDRTHLLLNYTNYFDTITGKLMRKQNNENKKHLTKFTSICDFKSAGKTW